MCARELFSPCEVAKGQSGRGGRWTLDGAKGSGRSLAGVRGRTRGARQEVRGRSGGAEDMREEGAGRGGGARSGLGHGSAVDTAACVAGDRSQPCDTPPRPLFGGVGGQQLDSCGSLRPH